MYFPNSALPKTWFDEYLKSSFSEDPSKNNIVNAPRHCSNLKEGPLTVFIYQWEGNCLKKSLC